MICIGCIGRCSSDEPGMKARDMNNGIAGGDFVPRYHHIIISLTRSRLQAQT